MKKTTPLMTRQHGATLAVTLIMLVLVLLLAASGMRAVTTEARIAAHVLEQQQMQEVAEAALRAGERAFLHGPWRGVPVEQCAAGAQNPYPDAQQLCYSAKVFPEDGPHAGRDMGQWTQWEQVAALPGLGGGHGQRGYWYARYIGASCDRGKKGCNPLRKPASGDTLHYEINAQATREAQAGACGAQALCLRSAISHFIQ